MLAAYAAAGAIVAHRVRSHLRAHAVRAPLAASDLGNAALWPVVVAREMVSPGNGAFERPLVPIAEFLAQQTPDMRHAWGRVLDVFVTEQNRFAGACPHVADAILMVNVNECSLPDKCRPRDFAYSLPYARPQVIVFHARSHRMPQSNLVALMRHELGHLCDPVPYVPNTGREQAADDIAEAITGERIYYDGMALQTLEPGEYPRPLWLHR